MGFKNFFKSILITYKSMINPAKFFPVILDYGWKLSIIHLVLLQLSLSLIALLLISFSAVAFPDHKNIDGFSEFIYSSVLLAPFMSLIPAMMLSIFMNVLNCRGSLFSYFRLSLCFMFMMINILFISSLVFGFSNQYFHFSASLTKMFAFLQLVPLFIYSLTALRISYSSSWIKSFISHAVFIGIFVFIKP